jgi:hypothetical protein
MSENVLLKVSENTNGDREKDKESAPPISLIKIVRFVALQKNESNVTEDQTENRVRACDNSGDQEG